MGDRPQRGRGDHIGHRRSARDGRQGLNLCKGSHRSSSLNEWPLAPVGGGHSCRAGPFTESIASDPLFTKGRDIHSLVNFNSRKHLAVLGSAGAIDLHLPDHVRAVQRGCIRWVRRAEMIRTRPACDDTDLSHCLALLPDKRLA
jgi:hypothetical protein